MRCAACGTSPCDPAHIKSVGSGGDDVENNLIALCRKHHTQSHAIGWFSFCQQFPSVKIALYNKGWDFDFSRKLREI